AERYLFGYGQDLPLADGSVDLVVFFNSLHHVPVADQPRALAEAARVLRPGGRVYVLEPLAEGAYFDMVRPVDDETAVRAAALAALKAAEELTEVTELVYLNPVRFADFATFRDGFVAVDPPVRAPLMAARAAEMKARFEASACGDDGGYAFDQPSRVNLLVSVRSAG
ncbi:MAG: class I SAM-dependent methyltransferase, partial [Alphaproteobacteria bacterium]